MEWEAPSNFGTGSDDCGRTDSVETSDAQLACASKTPAEIVALCDAGESVNKHKVSIWIV